MSGHLVNKVAAFTIQSNALQSKLEQTPALTYVAVNQLI